MGFEVLENGYCLWNRTFLRAFVNLGDDTVGAAGPLDGTLHRFTTDTITHTQDSALEDFTLADLAGSSTVALTYEGPVNLGTTQVGKKTQIENIAGADPTVEGLTGVLVVNAAADDWVCYWKFPAAVGIAIEGDGVSVDFNVPFPFNTPVA